MQHSNNWTPPVYIMYVNNIMNKKPSFWLYNVFEFNLFMEILPFLIRYCHKCTACKLCRFVFAIGIQKNLMGHQLHRLKTKFQKMPLKS